MVSLECPVPESVDHERRAQIRGVYEAILTKVGEAEDQYVQQRLERVLARLTAHGGWLVQLSTTAKALSKAYYSEPDVKRRVAEAGRRHILAALHYLCDPYDVIPDFNNSGYLDDAIVVNRCLSILRNRWVDLYDIAAEAK